MMESSCARDSDNRDHGHAGAVLQTLHEEYKTGQSGIDGVQMVALEMNGKKGMSAKALLAERSKLEGSGQGHEDGDATTARTSFCSLSLLAAVIGTILEFYDFTIYAFFAPEIGKLFFPHGSPSVRAVQTFSVFAGGFLMRPLGSLVLGAVGDKFGTAAALKWSIALMTVPTAATGLLPTYHVVGMWAPLLLTVIRLLQGLSVGGELVGAILHTTDHSAKNRKGFFCGLVAICGTVGNLLGAIFATILHKRLDKGQMLRWGWRVPFLAGSLLGVVGVLLRTQTAHTPPRPIPPPPLQPSTHTHTHTHRTKTDGEEGPVGGGGSIEHTQVCVVAEGASEGCEASPAVGGVRGAYGATGTGRYSALGTEEEGAPNGTTSPPVRGGQQQPTRDATGTDAHHTHTPEHGHTGATAQGLGVGGMGGGGRGGGDKPSPAVSRSSSLAPLATTPSSSPAATNGQETAHRPSLRALFASTMASSDKMLLVRIVLLSALHHCVYYTNYVWMGTYLSNLAPVPIAPPSAFAVTCVLQCMFVLSAPFWGWCGDRFGHRLLWVLAGVAISCLVSPLMFLLLSMGSIQLSYTYAVVAGAFAAFSLGGNTLAWITESLDDCPARFTAFAITYNVGAITGGAYPMLASALASYPGVRIAPVLPFAGFAIVVFVVLASALPTQRRKGLA